MKLVQALKNDLTYKARGFVPSSVFYAKYGTSLELAALEKTGLVNLVLHKGAFLIFIKE